MNDPRSKKRPGLWAHLTGFLAAFSAYLRARLQLAGLEAKEAALHYGILVGLLIFGLILLIFGYFFFCFGLIFAIAALIGTKHAWIWVTFGMALLHLAAAGAAVVLAKVRLSTPMFTATLEEFRKDQEWLTKESRS
jgi:uncharacterized membrane protein YqjE